MARNEAFRKIRELERDAYLAQHREEKGQQRQLDNWRTPSDAPPRRYRPNTMGPMEDVVEHRQHRKRVVGTSGGTVRHSSGLGESVFVLLILLISLYGLYQLCLHLLTQ